MKLSVIVPVYGVEKYIERCANSLFNQTLDHIEFIFVDDCTPDRSIELLQAVIEKHQERFTTYSWTVRIEKMPQNSGPASVRKHGLQMATGEYVIHCDSDDWVEPDMFRLMYETAEAEQADIVVSDYRVSDGEHVIRSMKGCQPPPSGQGGWGLKEAFINNLLRQKYAWTVWNKLFRRTACYKEPFVYPKAPMGEDLVIVLQCLLNGGKMAYLPQTLYNYFYNPDSICHVDSDEKLMSIYQQFKANTDIVVELLDPHSSFAAANSSLFTLHSSLSTLHSSLISLKWYAKKGLWSMPYDRQRRKMFLDAYSEINKHVLFCKDITLRDKVKYVLAYLGLFPKKGQKSF